jgi:hypothetical protein
LKDSAFHEKSKRYLEMLYDLISALSLKTDLREKLALKNALSLG